MSLASCSSVGYCAARIYPGKMNEPHTKKKRSNKKSSGESVSLPRIGAFSKLNLVSQSEESAIQLEPERKISSENTPKQNVTRFVYSEAVEAAFRYKFLSSAFGPKIPEEEPENAPPSELSFEIPRAKELYHDFLFIRKKLESNHQHIDRLRKELGEPPVDDVQPKPTLKLPKMSMRNVIALAKLKKRYSKTDSMVEKERGCSPLSHVPKLPPLSESSSLVANRDMSPVRSQASPSIMGH